MKNLLLMILLYVPVLIAISATSTAQAQGRSARHCAAKTKRFPAGEKARGG